MPARHWTGSNDAAPSTAGINTYQPYWAARGELTAQLGNVPAALEALDLAMGLEDDPVVRRFLAARKARLLL